MREKIYYDAGDLQKLAMMGKKAIVFVGQAGYGKTYLVNTIFEKSFESKPGRDHVTTTENKFELSIKGKEVTIIDAKGDENAFFTEFSEICVVYILGSAL